MSTRDSLACACDGCRSHGRGLCGRTPSTVLQISNYTAPLCQPCADGATWAGIVAEWPAIPQRPRGEVLRAGTFDMGGRPLLWEFMLDDDVPARSFDADGEPLYAGYTSSELRAIQEDTRHS